MPLQALVLSYRRIDRRQVPRVRGPRLHREHVRSIRVDLRAHHHQLRVRPAPAPAPRAGASSQQLTIPRPRPRNGITALSFSHDGEYIAIANTGSYIDIVGLFLSFPLDQTRRSHLTFFSVRDRDQCPVAQGPCPCIVADRHLASLKIRHSILRSDQAARRGPAPGRSHQSFWSRDVAPSRLTRDISLCILALL